MKNCIRRKNIGTLGPVADLEGHLPQEWWRELFDSLYLKTDGDVVENNANTIAEVERLITATGIGLNDRILDLCCGQGRHSLELAKRGFKNITGFDRSRYLIRLARKRARKQELAAVFKEGDARMLRLPEDSFDCAIMMGNSFGYFEQEEDDRKILKAVKRVLRSSGGFFLDITDGDWISENFERRSWEWIDQNHFVCRERTLSGDERRLITREVVTHAERGVIADQFYAERLYSNKSIKALLEGMEFQDVTFLETTETTSARGQDLGMMAKRVFITAKAPIKEPTRTFKPKPKLKITVVMGDPRLPDQVKMNGRFNKEDLDTIRILKEGLERLDDYDFDYLDNHGTLRSDLVNGNRDMVMNLCDEGYWNDALMELHVPALLETLRIPYTGAGPASLAICYDKSLTRAVALANEIPVPMETYVALGERSATLPSVFPAILKPSMGDSSIGITKDAVVHSAESLVSYMKELRETLPGRPLLVQEFLSGQEYSVTLLGNPGIGLEALPILEVIYTDLPEGLPHILGYESKWVPDSPYWKDISYREADLAQESQRMLTAYSSVLFERLGCRDYARFDYRADANGVIKLLEVNPNPGWCWDGKLNLMAGFVGMSYAELLQSILSAAQERLYVEPATSEQLRKMVA